MVDSLVQYGGLAAFALVSVAVAGATRCAGAVVGRVSRYVLRWSVAWFLLHLLIDGLFRVPVVSMALRYVAGRLAQLRTEL